MNILKKILIIIFVVIPIISIIYNLVADPFGYILLVDDEKRIILDELIPDYDVSKLKLIILDCKPRDYDTGYFINSGFKIDEAQIDEKNEFIEYSKNNGINIYIVVTVVNCISIFIIAIFMFFIKTTENINLFGNFDEGGGGDGDSGE